MQDLTRGSLTQARRPCHASSPPDARAAGHRRAKVTTMTDNPGVIAPPPLLYAGALAAGAVLEQIVPLPMLPPGAGRSEEHTSALQSLMRNSYAVFCLYTKQDHITTTLC